MSYNVFQSQPYAPYLPYQDAPGTSSNRGSAPPDGRKRTSRACDQCRRTRIKCVQAGEQLPCQACAEGGHECTFSGPRYRSGPPKGYIQALEQRWYQTEAILAVLLSSPNPLAQAVVTVLRRDSLAVDILDRVNNGPFGLVGRATLPQEASVQDVVAYATRSQSAPAQNQGHAKQSRTSRESMSNQTRPMSFRDLIQWQDHLAIGFSSSPASLSPYTVYVPQHADGPPNMPGRTQAHDLGDRSTDNSCTQEDQSEDESDEYSWD